MDDSFQFGQPGRGRHRPPRQQRQPSPGRPQGPRSQVALDPRLIFGAGLMLGLAVLIFFGMKFFSSSGKEVATTQKSVVNAADAAKDSQAQGALQTALNNAKLAYMDGGMNYSSAGPGQLSLLEPSLTYTDGPSTDPSVVSVQATDSRWSAAVMSDSGTCWWVSVSTVPGTRYGSGTTCTGAAAAGANGAKW